MGEYAMEFYRRRIEEGRARIDEQRALIKKLGELGAAATLKVAEGILVESIAFQGRLEQQFVRALTRLWKYSRY
jgi:hypothetical protein